MDDIEKLRNELRYLNDQCVLMCTRCEDDDCDILKSIHTIKDLIYIRMQLDGEGNWTEN